MLSFPARPAFHTESSVELSASSTPWLPQLSPCLQPSPDPFQPKLHSKIQCEIKAILLTIAVLSLLVVPLVSQIIHKSIICSDTLTATHHNSKIL